MKPKSTLTWHIKQSLINYISRAPGGNIAWEGTADSGVLDLNVDLSVPEKKLAFIGKVSMNAYSGMLDVNLSNFQIDLERGRLLVNIPQVEQDIGLVHLGTPDVTPLEDGFEIFYPKPLLTENGSTIFGKYYEPGAELDPIKLFLNNDDANYLTGADTSSE